MSEVIITKENFEQEVINSDIPVFVDFWATWCGPCQMIAPILEEISKEYEGKVKIGKVNVDEQQELAVKYKVNAIPNMILFKDGEIANTVVGYHDKKEIIDAIGL